MDAHHVTFRVFQMPCCSRILEWVDGRLPTFCPECGTQVISQIRLNPEFTKFCDIKAELTLSKKIPKV